MTGLPAWPGAETRSGPRAEPGQGPGRMEGARTVLKGDRARQVEWSRVQGRAQAEGTLARAGSPQRARCPRRSPEGEAALRVSSSVSALRAPERQGNQPAGSAQARGQARRAGAERVFSRGFGTQQGAVDGGCEGPKVVLARRASQPTRAAKPGAGNPAGTQRENVIGRELPHFPVIEQFCHRLSDPATKKFWFILFELGSGASL